jgi:isoquinoline 1-oxidoreductase
MPGRREFFLKMGGGIVMILAADAPNALAQQRRPYPEDFNAYLVVARDGRITVFSGKVEMGQGILTSQAQMVAEELDVALDRIDMVLGDTDRCPWDMGTFGSLTTRMFGPALRAAAAQARLTLLDLAAHKLDVTPDRLQVSNGVISVSGDASRKVSYAELSQGARIAHVVPQKAVLRAAKDFKQMGQSPRRLDAVEKATGTAKYTADIRLPGMLYARILRPPAHGAKLIEADTRAAEALPGVTVVREGDLIAVLHADPEAASKALARVRARWENPPTAKQTPENIFDHILAAQGEPRVIQERGNPGAAKPAKPLTAEYRKGYVAHAPIEPHAALAEMRDGKLTVWASTQTPFPVQEQIAQRLKLDPKQVRVRVPYIGGGFGGKSASGQAIEAAVLAVRSGKPVQVARTREEEFFLDTFDPACVVQIASGLDAKGDISHWDYTVHAAGERGAELLYDVADVRVRSVGRGYYESTAAADSVHPFAIGPWRAPGANMNIFAIESHIDTLAALAGSDTLEFRLQHMRNPRMRRVLQAAAAAFGWKAAAAPSRRGFGIACGMDAGTCVAVCAHVSVDAESGEVRVRRLVCAQDMGIVVNPEGAKMQIEGCLTMGLGYALSEELRFAGGRVLDRNFDSYPLPRFRGLPKIESVLIEDDTIAPQGGGEPGIVCTGAVIANAVFDASGARLLQLPMKPERVRAALAALTPA